MSADLREQLASGAGQLGVCLDAGQLDRLMEFIGLLGKWNRAYNLTAIDDPQRMVSHHLLDSLAIAPYLARLSANRVLDVGSGAGLPGIPLAIALAKTRFALLDSNGKKCRFLVQARQQLALANIDVEQCRVEHYRPDRPFDVIVSRAFATLRDMVDNAAHLLGPGGCFLAMKGRYPAEEFDALDPAWRVTETIPLHVPGLAADRHLVVIAAAA